MADTANLIGGHHAVARYLGADAALGYVVNYYLMSEFDACSILTDVDPAVLDRYPAPNLGGECAGDPTPHSVAGDVLDRCSCAVGAVACDEDYGDVEGRIADAWEQGRDLVWDDALHAVALRALGEIARADDIERNLEAQVTTLRQKRGHEGRGPNHMRPVFCVGPGLRSVALGFPRAKPTLDIPLGPVCHDDRDRIVPTVPGEVVNGAEG